MQLMNILGRGNGLVGNWRMVTCQGWLGYPNLVGDKRVKKKFCFLRAFDEKKKTYEIN